MTRDEVASKLREIFGTTWWTQGQMTDVVDGLAALGVIKFDEPKSTEQQLLEKLRNLMVEIEWRPFMREDARREGVVQGRLSKYGAGCVIECVRQLGLKLVRFD